MNHYLFSFTHDITKIREEILPNLDLLQHKEVQKEIEERIGNLTPEMQQVVLIMFLGTTLLACLPNGGETISKLFLNVKNRLKNKPFVVHSGLVVLVESLLFFEQPNEKQHHFVQKLWQEIKRDELFSEGDDQSFFEAIEATDQQSKNFPLYFAFTLRQIPILKMDDFLDYQLPLYEGDFKAFLENILIEFEEHEGQSLFKKKTRKAVKKWLKKNQFKKELVSKVGPHKSDDVKMKIVQDYLEWTKLPNSKGEKILFDKDFDRLMKYAKVLVTKDRLPERIKPITGISHVGFGKKIRRSFYDIHLEILGKYRINDKYIEFLHKVFPDKFTGEMSTTKKKFSIK